MAETKTKIKPGADGAAKTAVAVKRPPTFFETLKGLVMPKKLTPEEIQMQEICNRQR